MGRLPTGMTRSALPVLSARTLTVSLLVLALKTWPLPSSTSTRLGAVPYAAFGTTRAIVPRAEALGKERLQPWQCDQAVAGEERRDDEGGQQHR